MTDTITSTQIQDFDADNEAARAFDTMLQAQMNNGEVVTVLATSQLSTVVPHYARLGISNKMAIEFLFVYDECFKDWRKKWHQGNLQLVPYDGRQNNDEHIVEWIYLPRHEFLQNELEPMENHMSEVVTPKDMKDKKYISKLRFYAARITPWLPLEHPLVIFRRYTSAKVLGTSLIGAFWDGNSVYDRVEQSVFLFDRDIDSIQYGPWLFVFRQHDFHLAFKFQEAMQAAAKQTLERIRAKVPISNYEELLKDCQKALGKLLKLRNISQQDYLDELTMADVERVKAERGLSIHIEEINGVKHLRYDPKDEWDLLSLLDNDFVTGDMIKRKYRSHSKTPLPS